MPLPKKKNDIQIYRHKELTERRQELLDRITKSDTYLPDSILHDDLDIGMLDYIKKEFIVISDGIQIPVIDKILTIQRWSEFTNTWSFSDDDNNMKVPFIALIRKPDVQPGTNPSVQRTIPDRDEFHYATVANWNGNQMGADVYRIPQPVPVDISYELVIVCHKFRDLNRLSKIVLQRFSSRQDYTTIKGHYIPIVLDRISDNSPVDVLDGRRFYAQSYDFTMLGFLIDNEEFEVKPAISRILVVSEFVNGNRPEKRIFNKTVDTITVKFIGDGVTTSYNVGQTITELFYVAINGIIQEQNVAYFFIGNSSKISFVTPPYSGSEITISYYSGKNTIFVDGFGTPLFIDVQYFTYTDDLTFTLSGTISSVIYVNINGLVDEQGFGYTVSLNTVTLISTPVVGSKIGVCYIHY